MIETDTTIILPYSEITSVDSEGFSFENTTDFAPSTKWAQMNRVDFAECARKWRSQMRETLRDNPHFEDSIERTGRDPDEWIHAMGDNPYSTPGYAFGYFLLTSPPIMKKELPATATPGECVAWRNVYTSPPYMEFPAQKTVFVIFTKSEREWFKRWPVFPGAILRNIFNSCRNKKDYHTFQKFICKSGWRLYDRG